MSRAVPTCGSRCGSRESYVKAGEPAGGSGPARLLLAGRFAQSGEPRWGAHLHRSIYTCKGSSGRARGSENHLDAPAGKRLGTSVGTRGTVSGARAAVLSAWVTRKVLGRDSRGRSPQGWQGGQNIWDNGTFSGKLVSPKRKENPNHAEIPFLPHDVDKKLKV